MPILTAISSQPLRPLPPQPSPGAPRSRWSDCAGRWSEYAPHRADLVRSMCSRGQDPQSAEDIAQEAIVRAVTSRAPSALRVGRPRAWLERIAVNVMRDRLKRRGPQVGALEDVEDAPLADLGREPIPGDDCETSWVRTGRGIVRSSLLVDDLHCVLREMPATYREVLTLYYLEERTMEDTARVLGTRASLAKCWLYRARHALRERFVRRCGLVGPWPEQVEQGARAALRVAR